MTLTPVRTLFGVDLRTLALVRVYLGALVIADLVARALSLTAHYTDAGAAPRDALITIYGFAGYSLHMLTGSAWGAAVLFLIAGLFGLQLMVGYKSRTAAFFCWILLISLDARNQWVSQGGDLLLRVLMFWMIFLPIGARFSVDSALDKNLTQNNDHFSIASLGLVLQVLVVYFFTALLKSDPVWFPDGTAVYYALANDTLVTPFGEWLRQFPLLLQGLTYFVWMLELATPLLLCSPIFHVRVRLFALVLLINMHIGFFLCLNIGLFPFISIASLLALTPAVVWDWLSKRVRTPPRAGIRIFYDEDCSFCEKTCRLLTTFLILPDAAIAPAQRDAQAGPILEANNGWVVYDKHGQHYLRGQALAWLVRRSPLFGGLGRVMKLKVLARPLDWFYGVIARHRFRLSRLSAVLLPYRPLALDNTAIGNGVCALFVVVMLWNNLGSLKTVDVPVPSIVRIISKSVRLGQGWTMFAPHPSKQIGWFVARGSLADGQIVDLYRDTLGEPTWERETYLAHNYEHYRWRKYLARLPLKERAELRPYYVQYLCRDWQSQHPNRALDWVKVYYVSEHNRLPPLPAEASTNLLWQSRCGIDPAEQVLKVRSGEYPEVS